MTPTLPSTTQTTFEEFANMAERPVKPAPPYLDMLMPVVDERIPQYRRDVINAGIDEYNRKLLKRSGVRTAKPRRRRSKKPA
jgi:hypothetical protein